MGRKGRKGRKAVLFCCHDSFDLGKHCVFGDGIVNTRRMRGPRSALVCAADFHQVTASFLTPAGWQPLGSWDGHWLGAMSEQNGLGWTVPLPSPLLTRRLGLWSDAGTHSPELRPETRWTSPGRLV